VNVLKVLCVTGLALGLTVQLQAQNDSEKPRKRPRQQAGNVAQLLKRLDTNQDGMLGADEIPERLAKRLARFDSDGSGTIDRAEIRDMLKQLRAGQARSNPPARNPQGKGDGPAQRKGRRDASPGMSAPGDDPQAAPAKRRRGNAMADDRVVDGLLQRFDQNQDGLLSLEEAPERLRRVWERLDTDSSQVLEAAELERLPAMLRRARQNQRGDDPEKKSRGGVKPRRPGGDGQPGHPK
jgi:Ca2+-binding EF-hand superfamily protein